MADKAPFVAIVLAAGQGTRMKSPLPKVLHPLLGRAMVSYPVSAALAAGAEKVVVVVGHGREAVEAELAERFDARVITAVQQEQKGTGHAALIGAQAVPDFGGWLLILNGDAALLTSTALRALLEADAENTGSPLRMLTSTLDDPTGYGRILRDDAGRVVGVREERDCGDVERAICEWNPGVYAIRRDFFRSAAEKLASDNAQGELYLTDLVSAAAEAGVVALPYEAFELQGINDRAELADRERDLRLRRNRALGRAGVTLRDPESAFIDMDVAIEPDAVIEADVHLRGRTRVGAGAHIDVGCVLRDVDVAADAQLLPYTVAASSKIGSKARVGPFSHLRPESDLGPRVHVGNFVEIKKTQLLEGSKANHLAYLGDGKIGRDANIGAGTIFCNYDGFMKHLTTIGDRAFVGSDSQFVAPVSVGDDAYIGTGTTVTKDIPPGDLAIGRARQVNKPGLALRLRERLAEQARRNKARK